MGLQASPISGTFQLTGTVTVGQSGGTNTITWTSPGGANTALITDATGSFASVNNTYASIANLSNPPDGVGVTLSPDVSFINFLSDPSLGMLNLNYIFPGVDGFSGCTASTPAAGQVCTPTLDGTPTGQAGPFNMQNINGISGPQATITWAFAGNAYSGGSQGGTWEGNFTSQSNSPFQAILADLATKARPPTRSPKPPWWSRSRTYRKAAPSRW